MLKIEKAASLREASAGHAVQFAADTGSVTSATCFSCLIRCLRSADTHSSLLISSELKSLRVKQLRPFKFTGPREAAPTL